MFHVKNGTNKQDTHILYPFLSTAVFQFIFHFCQHSERGFTSRSLTQKNNCHKVAARVYKKKKKLLSLSFPCLLMTDAPKDIDKVALKYLSFNYWNDAFSGT